MALKFLPEMVTFDEQAVADLKRETKKRQELRHHHIVQVYDFVTNDHHEFQHDYRNGVKPWNFDPTKWIIWTLSKLGVIRNLRRVAQDKILLAEERRKAEIEFEKAGSTASPEGEEGVALARVKY